MSSIGSATASVHTPAIQPALTIRPESHGGHHEKSTTPAPSPKGKISLSA